VEGEERGRRGTEGEEVRKGGQERGGEGKGGGNVAPHLYF